jgi:hypothetical protein
MTITEYFAQIRQLMQTLTGVRFETYVEQVFTERRGNVRIRVRFTGGALLEVSEAIVIPEAEAEWLSYRYHFQEADGSLVFRYDDAPHHPEVKSFPHHKHTTEGIVESDHPSLGQVIQEILLLRKG